MNVEQTYYAANLCACPQNHPKQKNVSHMHIVHQVAELHGFARELRPVVSHLQGEYSARRSSCSSSGRCRVERSSHGWCLCGNSIAKPIASVQDYGDRLFRLSSMDSRLLCPWLRFTVVSTSRLLSFTFGLKLHWPKSKYSKPKHSPTLKSPYNFP